MAITATTRACHFCRGLINEPAASSCPACGRAVVAHHSTWPAPLKWWLVVEFVRSRFLPWKGSQEVWEELLRDALNGAHGVPTIPERARLGITDSTSAATLYPIALERSVAWRASGSPIERPPETAPATQGVA